MSRTSAAMVPPKLAVVPPPTPPANTARPKFTGTLRTGQKLTCSAGTFTGATGFACAWLRNGAPIAVAKTATYTLTNSDAAKALQCSVTATGSGGSVVADSASRRLGVSASRRLGEGVHRSDARRKTLAAARKALTSANCALGKTTTRKSTKKPGTVLSSSPAKGKEPRRRHKGRAHPREEVARPVQPTKQP